MSKLIEVANEQIFPLSQAIEDVLIRDEFLKGSSDGVMAMITGLAMAILLQGEAPKAMQELISGAMDYPWDDPNWDDPKEIADVNAIEKEEAGYAKISPQSSTDLFRATNAYAARLERAVKNAGLWSESELFKNLLVAASEAAVTYRSHS